MPDFLLELLSEEIPARMQPRARDDLARLFAAEIAKAGLKAEAIETFSTPRRLALIARGLPDQTEAVRDELKGPRSSAPPQALEGFLRKTGLSQDQLTERDGVFYAIIDKPGRATASVLAETIPALIRGFPWPKSMRWGAASQSTESLRWVRPLHGIVALLGGEIVPCEIDGIESGAETVGHRFHHPGRITIGSADDYAAKLRACHVLVDHEEREAIIATGATTIAAQAGLTLVRDEALLRENAGLTEWPVPLLGSFDASFLEVPPEVIQLTMAVNQKYFALLQNPPLEGEVAARRADGGVSPSEAESRTSAPLHHQPAAGGPPPLKGEDRGNLAPAFICTANVEPRDGGATIVAGNQKVLAARLSDAKFFWEQDLKVPLEDQARKLDQIVFHEKLGTVADKVERVAKLARWLVEEGIVGGSSPASDTISARPERSRGATGTDSEPRPSTSLGTSEGLADMAEQAARLCKADLVTGMVGEFPELQGIMGGYYARAQGYPDAVADAIRDHYKPVGQGDEVPTAPVTVAVSLADKLDTLAAFFAYGMLPTGSKDPFALRRAALGVALMILNGNLRLRLFPAVLKASLEILIKQEKSLSQKAVLAFGQIAPTFGTQAGSEAILAALKHAPMTAEEEANQLVERAAISSRDLLDFFADRLKVQQREAGVRHDLIDAVFALGGEDDLVRLLARVRALQAFVETSEGADLLAGYKRAANILKKEGWQPFNPLPSGEGRLAAGERGEGDGALSPSPSHAAAQRGPSAGVNRAPRGLGHAGGMTDPGHSLPSGEGEVQGIPQTGEEDPFVMAEDLRDAIMGHEKLLSYTPAPEEQSLAAALDSAEPRARAAVEAEDFEGAMAALASLRAPVDAFFEYVTVNDPDPVKRAARLNLLARVRDAVHGVADFSRIEG